MPREVTDAEGTTWSCIQAFAGLGGADEKKDVARTGEPDGRVHVVCTPTGGAQSVRVKLPENWEQGASDEELLRAIEAARG